MNRRQFVSTSGVAALAFGRVPEVAAAAPVPAAKPVLMKLGCQSAPTNDVHLKYLARYGVRNICGYPEVSDGRIYSTVDELSRMKELAEKNGIEVDCVGPQDTGVELYRQGEASGDYAGAESGAGSGY